MKRNRALTLLTIVVVAAAGVLAGSFWQRWSATSSLTAAGSSLAVAAEEPLKAGMVDPQTGKKIKYWVAPMDPTYIRDEPGKSPMGMDLVPVYEEEGGEKEPTSTIRIDPVTIQNMGIRTAPVIRKPVTKTIRTFGNVTYDETRMVSVNTKFDGWIEKLHVNFLGERIKRGQPLFDIYSPELVTTQEEYLLALKQYRSLKDSSFVHVRDSAERLMAASRKRLEYWDMSDSQIRQLETTGQVRKAITIFSPSGGVVIQKDVVEGEFAKAGKNQYQIADLSTVWVDVDIYEYELPYVKKGMPARMVLSYVPGERFQGEVLYIYPYLSKETRTVRLRLAFPNPELQLKPDMYANIRLEAELPGPNIVIPQEAVIDTGVRQVVFVSRDKGKFEPREIKLGVEVNGHQYQVLKGLSEGEEIVISAQFMLDSESRLREAVQKMLEVGQAAGTDAPADDDLDMSGLSMDDELDMSGLSMDDADTSAPQ
ncbi:MAG: efflux RND transporter periplasmic adaptor subunit [Desulfobacteraceae bacterium]|nr:efflux RND transporter periplasmic adaptor subunit [Desulfobacteraceae bacterium]MBC2752053.1 efflux RND transporter periplasmic adaptor subunit [Desulfobacteraceae bacterium]